MQSLNLLLRDERKRIFIIHKETKNGKHNIWPKICANIKCILGIILVDLSQYVIRNVSFCPFSAEWRTRAFMCLSRITCVLYYSTMAGHGNFGHLHFFVQFVRYIFCLPFFSFFTRHKHTAHVSSYNLFPLFRSVSEFDASYNCHHSFSFEGEIKGGYVAVKGTRGHDSLFAIYRRMRNLG